MNFSDLKMAFFQPDLVEEGEIKESNVEVRHSTKPVEVKILCYNVGIVKSMGKPRKRIIYKKNYAKGKS